MYWAIFLYKNISNSSSNSKKFIKWVIFLPCRYSTPIYRWSSWTFKISIPRKYREKRLNHCKISSVGDWIFSVWYVLGKIYRLFKSLRIIFRMSSIRRIWRILEVLLDNLSFSINNNRVDNSSSSEK